MGLTPNAFLPLAAALVSFLFTLLVLAQFLRRRRPFQLVWSLGLALYGASTLAEFLGNSQGWSETVFRWWYLTGAIAVAAFLGLGTVYLQPPGRFGWWVVALVVVGALPALRGNPLAAAVALLAAAAMALVQWRAPARLPQAGFALLVTATLWAGALTLSVPVEASLLPGAGDESPKGNAFPAGLRALTPMFNIPGGLAMAGGAASSAWFFWRRRAEGRRALANLLIFLGAVIPSVTSLLSRIEVTSGFYLGQLLGILLIFAGFLIAGRR